MKANTKKVWITVRNIDNSEDIKVFDSYDEIHGLYDYTKQIVISESTYKKLATGDYYAARKGNTIVAKSK